MCRKLDKTNKTNKKMSNADTSYRIQLEPYKGRSTRHICPSCGGKNTFTRYVDITTGDYIGDDFGRCNRVEKCGFHKPPNSEDLTPGLEMMIPRDQIKEEYRVKTEIDLIDPRNVLNYSYHNDNLSTFLYGLFPVNIVELILNRYHIGTIRRWGDRATMFWQIDKDYRVKTGKVMLYSEETGKRVKEPFNKITWAHIPGVIRYEPEVSEYGLEQCFFGEHLLNTNPKVVHVVESEKTAILCSMLNPEVVWVATGGLEMISEERLLPFKDCKLVFYPDKGEAFNKWTKKLEQFKDKFNIVVNKTLESKDEINDGDDLGDLVIQLQKNKQ